MIPLATSFFKREMSQAENADSRSVSTVVKGLLVILTVLVGWVTPAAAQEWTLNTFDSQIEIRSDASIKVIETITADFSVPKHGIFRNIPYQYTDDQGERLTIPLTVTSVTQDGRPAAIATSQEDNELKIRIGDPDITLTGRHIYIVSYTADAAVNFLSDHDELYWNVTGSDWDVSMGAVTVTVKLPATVPAENIPTACYTGPVQSTQKDCTSTSANGQATFSAHDYLTVVIGWPKGIIELPAHYNEIRQHAARTGQWPYVLYDSPWKWVINIMVPILALFALVQHWLRAGRDPKTKTTSVVQYDPPPGLTPGEMGVLIDERANHADVVATIVDMAVRGYLDITETEKKKGLLGTGGGTDYILSKKKEFQGAANLQPHEVQLLSGLFKNRDHVSLAELKGSFHTDVQAIESSLYSQVAAKGYFHANPRTVRWMWLGGGIGLGFFSFYLIGFGIIGPIVTALFIILFSTVMPQRTQKGADAFWHAKGFKEYLSKAEKYRLKWQEQQHIFETYLPYAMAFGVADKWSQAFEGIDQASPAWYHGAVPGHFNSLVLWSAMSDFSTDMTRSFSPPAASGGSGFGGGGFSGGGFGGGGGGSW